MSKANISKSILSITSPGTYLVPGDVDLARDLTRKCNEFAADVKRRNPDKFGFWASLPLPDVEGALAEMDYALDVLNADGFVVLTNAHGVYLGDSSLDPIFQELNRRKAKLFIHPTSPCLGHDHGQLKLANPLPQYPAPMLEFFFDTARALGNMFISGLIANSPDITIMVSHAGGALTPLIARFSKFATTILGNANSRVNKESVIKALRTQFYFDMAGFVFPEQIHGLLPYVDASRITYGSDYPLTPEVAALELVQIMDEHIPNVFNKMEDRDCIYKGNARKILQK